MLLTPAIGPTQPECDSDSPVAAANDAFDQTSEKPRYAATQLGSDNMKYRPLLSSFIEKSLFFYLFFLNIFFTIV